MADILCAQCGEPWDAYGVRQGDMEPDEAELFLAGKGCPACGFGLRNGDEALPWEAAESELEWSDEEPLGILERRGLC